ncbi:immunoglobulin-like and fibronectin type III domain-containing protein 1 [Synchiropus splendidus]|uniref:immunoglobulin-like and fibronectin type III domain-containing protein 1 n=1 Tax=Synchiropus splendidus TaxID=270530 RepID=UPI00237E8362|nr:immunoglobulin-like and fibronectin type III domain-containing protein 1 [Synchiropus splendidus]
MITQFVEELPEGMSTPDFTRKPIAVTLQEGKTAIFRAIITGQPAPTVTWVRNNGEIDEENYKVTFDKSSGEHQLQIPDVSVEHADTYKCFATNEYGKAIVTATLHVIEVGFKKNRALQQSRTAIRELPEDFKKNLKATPDGEEKEDAKPKTDEKFWELLMSADKKDYESICSQYGVTDFRGMLKKLSEKKMERQQEQERVVERLCNLKPIEMREDGGAEFELEMSLKDPTSKIFLYKDGVMVPFDPDTEIKHGLKQVGKKFVFSINGVNPEDAGLYQVEVDGVKVFSTDLKVSSAEFLYKIQDVTAEEREDAVFECVISTPMSKINWKGKNVLLEQGDKFDILVSDDMLIHTLVVKDCKLLDKGIYAAEAGMASCSAWLVVEDPGVYFTSGLSDVTAIIGTDTMLVCKLSSEDCEGVWYKEGVEITSTEEMCIVKDGFHRKLVFKNCKEEDAGKYKYEADGRKTEAVLRVEDPPRLNEDDLAEFKKPITIKTGKDAAFKVSFIGREPMKIQWFQDGEELLEDDRTKIEKAENHTRLVLAKCNRKISGEIKVKIKNECGVTEAVTQLNVLAYPGPPTALKIISAFKDCINLAWTAPVNTGGTNLFGYNVEKRKNGSNLWGLVNPPDEPIKEKKYAVKDVVEGIEYEFRVSAINISGVGEPSQPSEFVFARDPKKPPGKVIDLRVTDSTYTTLSLGWTKPIEEEGVQDEAKGYFVELRPAENPEWCRCNSSAIIMNSYTIMGLKSMAMYWVRVLATNEGGDGEAQELDNYIIAMPPPVRPQFTDKKIKNFMVMRAGNAARVTFNFVASPLPNITWLKDDMPVGKHVTISNSDTSSQLIIPSSERHDTGIYTIIVKNLVGQETSSVEIRVTDDPKPPGPVELDENVSGTVTVSWDASPDEKKDDRLHYMITKRDSVKRTWQTVADHLFNNKFTAINIMPGRQYKFRVYAKNDMGMSKPSESQNWEVRRKKESFSLNLPATKDCSFEAPPSFSVPLKTHNSPESYECYMSCAVTGNPKPYVTWYRNNISLNSNSNYYITNTCGVCSLVILKVGPKDSGEYTVIAENSLGREECSTKLVVKD